MLASTLLFALLAMITSIFDGALITLGRWESDNILHNIRFRRLINFLILFKSKSSFEGIRFVLKTAKYAFRVLFGLSVFLYLQQQNDLSASNFFSLLKAIFVILSFSYILDFFSALIYYRFPKGSLRFLAFPISIISLLFLPFGMLSYFIMNSIHPELFKSRSLSSKEVSQKIRQSLEESGLADYMDASDRKLMFSLVSFKDKIAREIMVPRIKIFSVDIKTSVIDAVKKLSHEGYSRFPVYENNVDNIVGILLFKDLLSYYATIETDSDPRLLKSIEFLVKPATFTPETKKISHLLQEFRIKQAHLAVVVDEWGGTEGIVSIEDILEELVGEIADEYDTDEEAFFAPLASGGWIVDARMSIKDIEQELGITIPPSPEYDTLGGYIFHKAGAIPNEGYKIHHASFDLEVLSSSERSVDKVKISKT